MSPHWDGIKEETSRAFSAWHEKQYGQSATIRWREAGGGTSQVLRFLRSEYQGNSSSGIDVLYGGGIDPFIELGKDGLLTPYDPPADVLAGIPAQLNGMALMDPKHQWFGAALSGFGIITNERVRQAVGLPEVHAWGDLTDPRLQGWISACDPRASGSALTVYEIILQSYGWEKGWGVLMEVSGNVRNFISSSAASAVEVGMGDAAYGVAIDSYGNAQAGYYGPENVTFTLPEGQTMIDPDSIAILKNPPHPILAQHLLEFVLSRAGQSLWMLPKGVPGGATRNAINRMSVMPALYDQDAAVSPIRTNPFTQRSDFVYSNALGSRRRAILSVLIAACMIDTHDVLAPAWKALHSPAMQKLSPPSASRPSWRNSPRHRAPRRSFFSLRIPTGKIRSGARPWSTAGRAMRWTATNRFWRKSIRTDLIFASALMTITAQHLTKSFGPDSRVVNDVSFAIQPGEMFFLLGPSGCGKTTVLRMLAGFVQPDSGDILFDQKRMNDVAPQHRNTAMVFQNYAIWPHLSVYENVAYGPRARKLDAATIDRQVTEALRVVRLEDLAQRKPAQLSGGQQQRVALARALAVQPDLILLDEPLSNLDARLRLELRAELRRIHRETRTTCLYVTHDQEEALSLADRVAVMQVGRIEQVGPPREIYEVPRQNSRRASWAKSTLSQGRVPSPPCSAARPTASSASGPSRRAWPTRAWRPSSKARPTWAAKPSWSSNSHQVKSSNCGAPTRLPPGRPFTSPCQRRSSFCFEA